MSWLDLFLQLFLAAVVYAVIQVVSRIWENRQACRVPPDRAAPENNENPVAEDKPPAKTSPKSPDKFSVIVKIMGSEKQLVIESLPSDRVIDVKSKIQEMDGTLVKFQRLIFCGRPLENQSFLKSCGVVDGSVIHFVCTKESPFQVTVKTLTGKRFVVNCDMNETVEDLKNNIDIVFGIVPDQQRLIFNREQLKDEQYLHYYNIKNNSEIFLLVRLRGGFSLKIRLPGGRLLEVTQFENIAELKNIICKETGIEVHNQVLSFDGTVLDDAFTKADVVQGKMKTIDLISLK